MNQIDIANLRLHSQQIAKTQFKSPKEIVGWMGAMQAQDFNMAKWAIGLRLNKTKEKHINAAIDSAEIIRTHLLRPTWHFVSADDIYWMVDLTAPGILSSMKGRNKQLELTGAILKKSFAIIEKSLKDANHLTRKDLVNELNKAKIVTNENRSSHILFHAELEGIICSGKMKDKLPTYALLNERIKKPAPLKKEEALYKLACKYFESHCPATFQDFVWWSGLSMTDGRKALELIKSNFVSEKKDSKEYWFPRSFSFPKKSKESVFLLPAFDEFLISYKDRSAVIHSDHREKTFSSNGIFWPVILVNGRAVGIWKREIKKNQLIISCGIFDKKNKVSKELLEKATRELGYFLNCPVKIM